MRAVCLKLLQDTALGTAADCFIAPKLEENRTGNEGYCTRQSQKAAVELFSTSFFCRYNDTLALSAEIQTKQ